MVRTYMGVNNLITEKEKEILQFPVEFLNSLELHFLFPYTLTLKIGAIIILLRNLNASKGILNGTRSIIWNMYSDCLDLEIIAGGRVG